MRQQSSVLTLAMLWRAALSHTQSQSSNADTTTDIPEIPHPYWWEGPYTESLKDNVHGSNTPFPLPTFHLSIAEEPCVTTSPVYPTEPPTSTSCETDTAAPYSDVSTPMSLSQVVYSPSTSAPLPTFVYSPQPTSLPQPYSTPCLSSLPGYYSVTPSLPAAPSDIPSYSTQGSPSSYVISIPSYSAPLPESTLGYPNPSSYSISIPGYSAPLPESTPSYPASLQSASEYTVVQPTYSITIVQPSPSQQSVISYQPVSASYIVSSYQSAVSSYLIIPIPTPNSSNAPSIYTLSIVASSATPLSPASSGAPSTPSESVPASGSASTAPPVQTVSGSSVPPLSTSSVTAASTAPQYISSISQPIPASPTTLITQASGLASSAPYSTVLPTSGNPGSSGSVSTPEPSSVQVAATSAQSSTQFTTQSSSRPSSHSSFTTSTSTRSTAPTHGTTIPLAPSAAGAPGVLGGRSKEKVWWVAFLLPLLLRL